MALFDNNVLKSLVAAVNGYVKCPSDQSSAALHRQLDVVTTLVGQPDIFSPCLLLTEAISALVGLYLDPATRPGSCPSLLVKTTVFLLSLVRQCRKVRRALCSVHQFHYAFAAMFHQCNPSIQDPGYLQSLQLLELVSYGVEVSYIDDGLKNLLLALVQEISQSSEASIVCLSLLNNLCRRNPAVQNFLQNRSDARQLYKLLMSRLAESHQDVVICSLSLLASLVLHDPAVGPKIFSGQRLTSTLELVLNVVMTGEPQSKRRAVDLLLDLMAAPSLQPDFSRFKFLSESLTKILDVCLKEENQESLGPVLSLLMAFLGRTGQIIRLLQSHYLELLVRAVLAVPMEDTELVSQGLEVLGCVLHTPVVEVAPDLLGQLSQHLLAHLPRLLQDPDPSFCSLLQLLKVLHRWPLPDPIPNWLQENDIMQVVDSQLSQFQASDLSPARLVHGRTVVKLLSLASELWPSKLALSTFLQGSRIYQVLSCGLVSADKPLINDCLHLITFNLPEFSHSKLSEALASQQPAGGMSASQLPCLPNPGPTNPNFQALIDKLDSSLNLSDLKQSEIMELYEQKLLAFELREKKLQEVVSAKATALQQSDQLLAQYRSQQASQETESTRLRHVIKNVKSSWEDAQVQLQKAYHTQKQLSSELDQKSRALAATEQLNQEQKETLAGLERRTQGLTKMVESLQMEHQSQVEMNSVLQKHNESLRVKQDVLTQQIADLESLKSEQEKAIRDRDAKIKDLQKNLNQLGEELKQQQAEGRKLQSSLKSGKESLQAAEQKILVLEQELRALELVCSQREATITELSAQNRHLNDEIKKVKEITAMIHNLTGKPS